MPTVKIYRYDYTDTRLGQPARAKRMGTKEYIEELQAIKEFCRFIWAYMERDV
jgi:hypothetical protein